MRYLIFAAALFFLPACATVNNSSVDHFRIDSVPQGAKVTTTIQKGSVKTKQGLETKYYGCEATPCAIALPRHSKFIASVSYPGYEPAEIYIGNSSSAGAFAGDMAATTASVAGVAASSAATTAALLTATAEITSILLTSYANVASFGAVPVSTGLIPATSTSSAMAAAVPPALAVTGSMLLIDAASGANKSLFPNPVVLGLVPEGGISKIDPFAILFKEELRLTQEAAKLCETGPLRETSWVELCNDAKGAVKDIRQKQKDVRALVKKAQKEAAKASKTQKSDK